MVFVRVTDRIVKVKFHFCDKRFGTYFEGSACATWTTDKLYPIILVIVFLLLTGTMMHKFYNIVKKKENETEKENKEPIDATNVENELENIDISEEEVDIIKRLMTMDTNKRATFIQNARTRNDERSENQVIMQKVRQTSEICALYQNGMIGRSEFVAIKERLLSGVGAAQGVRQRVRSRK